MFMLGQSPVNKTNFYWWIRRVS